MTGQDPLAQLRDIHLPEPVSWWPLAWGWWVMIAVLLIGLALGLFFWLKRRRHLRYRYQALAELNGAHKRFQSDHNTSAYLQSVSELLRRATLSALPAGQGQQVTARSGEAWLAFLDASLPSESGAFARGAFLKGPGRILLEGPYQPNPQADVGAVQKLARQWLLHHRARQAIAREHAPAPNKPSTNKSPKEDQRHA